MTFPKNPPAAAHGLTTKHRLLIARINDLVIDINALPEWCAFSTFFGHTTEFRVRAIHGAHDDLSAFTYDEQTYLPASSTARGDAETSLEKLVTMAGYLEQLLEANSCAN